MRMSCNGCRVLRKGCSDNCSIRPCLQWIKSPESQAHATVFLAKFYGRAGLLNLLNAGPDHLRPAIFRSLLYEACGRIVNPIYGSVGLLWSGSWQLCQAAVEAVLKGLPITPIASEAAANSHAPPSKVYDIRHVSKEETAAAAAASASAAADLRRVRARCRFKRSGAKARSSSSSAGDAAASGMESAPAHDEPAAKCSDDEPNRSTSHESSLSHQSEVVAAAANAEGDSKETLSAVSDDTTAGPPLLFRAAEPEPDDRRLGGGGEEIGLELTLGFEPVARANHVVPVKKRRFEDRGSGCKMDLGLECSAHLRGSPKSTL
ncbi:LOB domain-containing protein 40-like [Syzygium oleosum]|uniref:LOB domain-containing protein 40-like n=1 Tax=Syzygium oleosum TaxID=219896 RepID=UPI0024BBDEC4|nr:LOB domain-containing protein 40-like [Syzygium oleosum]